MEHALPGRELTRRVRQLEGEGLSIALALTEIIRDQTTGWFVRGHAAQVLAVADRAMPLHILLDQLASEDGKDELWDTALALEGLADVQAVTPLIAMLASPSAHRRRAVARALGWIPTAGHNSAVALSRLLTDSSQPAEVREEAAESLGYLNSVRAIAPLISVLHDADVRVRFWAVFALGSICDRRSGKQLDRSVVPALEGMLQDLSVPPGNWWSVAREALAMLGKLDPPEAKWRDQLANDIRQVLLDKNASPDDRRWAEAYAG